jgi:hypothetical protein
MPLPVDFEKLVKLPKANGYPHSIRAIDLMRNFAYCDLQGGSASESESGLWAELEDIDGETSNHPQRRIVIKGGGGGGGIEFELLIVENGELRLLDVLTKTGESKPIP